MDTTIIEARREDAAELLALQKKCYQQEAEIYNDYQIAPLTQALASMHADLEQLVFLKLLSAEKIIGSVRAQIEQGTGKIGRLIVHPDYQNRGLGRQLMNAIEVKLAEVDRYELFTGHRSLKNLTFYQKLGYAEFRREPVNPKVTLVFLEKINSGNHKLV